MKDCQLNDWPAPQDHAAKRCSLTESRCPRRQGVKLQTEFLALNKSLLSRG